MRLFLLNTAIILGLALPAMAFCEPQLRLTPDEVNALPKAVAGVGTSGLPAVQTIKLVGDPAKTGPYVIRLIVAPNTTIAAHSHRDARTATVVAGLWHFGYGAKNDPAQAKALPPGSFYTEPAGEDHFAATTAEGAIVDITGYGPSDTIYVKK